MSFGGGGQVGEAWYNLTVRDEGVMAGLHDAEAAFKRSGDAAEQAYDDAGDAVDEYGRKIKSTATETGKVGGIFDSLKAKGVGAFKEIGIGFAQNLGAVATQAPMMAIQKLGEAVELAKDKAESASKVNVLFGASAGIVEEASKNAANTVNMSSGAYLAAAGDLGNLTTNLGFTGDEAANMSVDMLKLAADMGSFNNATPTEVVEAMGAAFRGETEPIRRFGVMLSEAGVQQQAVKMGLIATTAEFGNLDFATQQNVKAQATYAAILDQTKNAQGDLERTSESLANQQQRSAALQEEAWTKIGEKLVPIVQSVLPHLTNAITLVVDALGLLIDGITGVIDFISPLTKQIENLVKLALGPLKPATEGAALAITAVMVPALAKMVLGFGASTLAAVTSLASTLTMGLIPALGKTKGALDDATTSADGFSKKLGGMSTAGLLAGVAAGLYAVNEGLNLSNEHMKLFNERVGELSPEARDAAAQTEVLGFKLGDIAEHFANLTGAVVPWHDLADNAREGADALNGVESAIKVIVPAAERSGEAVDGFLSNLDSRSREVTARVLTEVKANSDEIAKAVVPSADAVAEHYVAMMEFAGRQAAAAGINDARKLGESIPGEIGAGMQQEANEVLDAAQGLRDLLKNGLTPEERAMKLIGADYTKLVAQGMKSDIDGAKEAAQTVAAAAINTIEDAGLKGVKGQKGLKAIGIYYDQLMASGLTAGEARALLAAEGVADATIDGLESETDGAPKVANAYVNAFNAALRNRKGSVLAAMQYTFGAAMRGQSPPKEGPLRDAVLSAGKVAEAYVENFNRGLGGLRFAGIGDTRQEFRATIRHEIDLRNAPPGVTNAGVADIVNRGTDATGLSFNLRHAATLRFREAV